MQAHIYILATCSSRIWIYGQQEIKNPIYAIMHFRLFVESDAHSSCYVPIKKHVCLHYWLIYGMHFQK